MKIGIDIRPLNTGRRSGVEGYIINLLSSLFEVDSENEYKLFCNSFKKADFTELNIDKYPNVKLYNFNYPNKILNTSLKFLRYPKIDKLLGEVDIFFEPNILFNSLSDKCRSIFTFHDLSFITHTKYYSIKRRLWHKLINPSKFAQKAHGIIAVSHSTKNDLVNIFGIDPDKIKVIYSGIKDVNNLSSEVIVKARLKNNIPDKYILYLGAMEPRKNIIGLISAFERLKHDKNISHKLVLAGSKGWLSKKIMNKINNSKYKKDIVLFGFVDEELKNILLNLADMFVFPSYYEGFGFPPLEAMAAKTPVIVSSVSSLPEVCGKAALYVDPYNVMEIYKMMLQIIEDDLLRDKLISYGLAQIEKFKWEKTAIQTKEYFEQINNS